MEYFIAAATKYERGDGTVVSFGSGDSGGRTQASARGRQGNRNASRNQVSSARSRINRAGTAGRTRAARERRALLQRIESEANSRGNINRRRLSQILNDLNAIRDRVAQRGR